ncbi:MAG: peptidoglycan-binding protein [Epibacterium sp.]|nr:peptidoglycan-binding protein [Epibacterium sp.]NQX72172.1 peptidoglycan-binding protein [Epibacterium sp.]
MAFPPDRTLWRSGVFLCATLVACAPVPPALIGQKAPPGAHSGTCWSTVILPARIETRSEQVEVSPARYDADGRMVAPATYTTETRQGIVTPRQERFFQTPCPEELVPVYVASLQRALTARNLYTGPISGTLDAATGAAIRAYQQPLGIDSADLSLDAARKLGLSVLRR